jgi:hypothetical protein
MYYLMLTQSDSALLYKVTLLSHQTAFYQVVLHSFTSTCQAFVYLKFKSLQDT